MGKIGRNDLCPCGSGKKYKKCFLAKDEEKRFLADSPPINSEAEEIDPDESFEEDERILEEYECLKSTERGD